MVTGGGARGGIAGCDVRSSSGGGHNLAAPSNTLTVVAVDIAATAIVARCRGDDLSATHLRLQLFHTHIQTQKLQQNPLPHSPKLVAGRMTRQQQPQLLG